MTWSLYYPPMSVFDSTERAPRLPQSDMVNMDFTTTFSLEFCLRVVDLAEDLEDQWIMTQDDALGISFGVRFSTADGDEMELYVAQTAGGSPHIRSFPVNADDGAWHHYAFTFNGAAGSDATQMEAFEDGASVGNGTLEAGALLTGTFTVDGDFVLGGLNTADDTELQGCAICDVRVWNDIRTLSEINTNKNARLVGNEAGLVGLWLQGRPSELPFGKGATGFLDDITANTNDIVFRNANNINQPYPIPSFPPAHAMGVTETKEHAEYHEQGDFYWTTVFMDSHDAEYHEQGEQYFTSVYMDSDDAEVVQLAPLVIPGDETAPTFENLTPAYGSTITRFTPITFDAVDAASEGGFITMRMKYSGDTDWTTVYETEAGFLGTFLRESTEEDNEPEEGSNRSFSVVPAGGWRKSFSFQARMVDGSGNIDLEVEV